MLMKDNLVLDGAGYVVVKTDHGIKKGDKILVVDPVHTGGVYSRGDILDVSRVLNTGIHVDSVACVGNREGFLSNSEFVKVISEDTYVGNMTKEDMKVYLTNELITQSQRIDKLFSIMAEGEEYPTIPDLDSNNNTDDDIFEYGFEEDDILSDMYELEFID